MNLLNHFKEIKLINAMSRIRISDIVKKELIFNQNYNCNICNCKLPTTYQIDHIQPWSLTFDNSINNLQALCPNCHAKKTQIDISLLNENKMEIDTDYICDCKPNFKWSNKNNFNRHFYTKTHINFTKMEID